MTREVLPCRLHSSLMHACNEGLRQLNDHGRTIGKRPVSDDAAIDVIKIQYRGKTDIQTGCSV